MTCDYCKEPLEGQPFSLTEHGRLHMRCLRIVALPDRLVRGVDGEQGGASAIYGLAWKSPAPESGPSDWRLR